MHVHTARFHVIKDKELTFMMSALEVGPYEVRSKNKKGCVKMWTRGKEFQKFQIWRTSSGKKLGLI